MHEAADRPAALVTDPAGRLWAPDAPAWLAMDSDGLAAPDSDLLQENGPLYQYPILGYPVGAFPLDLPRLPDGRLGVAFGDGTVRPLAEVGANVVAAAAQDARREPFGTVVLWTTPPAGEAEFEAFARDTELLAAAFGTPVVRARRGVDPFARHAAPGSWMPAANAAGESAQADPPELEIMAPGDGAGLPGYLTLADDGRLVATNDRDIMAYEGGALLFGAYSDDEQVRAVLEGWHSPLLSMPAVAGALPLVVVNTLATGEPSWQSDRPVPLTAQEVVDALNGAFRQADGSPRPASPIRLVSTRMAQNEGPLEALAEEISALLGGQPVYVGHDATHVPELEDVAAPRWVPVVASTGAASAEGPDAPTLEHVRDSLTGALVALDHEFEPSGSETSEWYLAGASVADLLVVPLIDEQGIFGVDLTGRLSDDRPPPGVSLPGEPDTLAAPRSEAPASPNRPQRRPGGFVVVADGDLDVVLGQHSSLGGVRIPPDQLAAIVLAHAPRGFAGPVHLGVGVLEQAPGANVPRPGNLGYAASLRAELGVPVYATHQREPEYTEDGVWHEAPPPPQGEIVAVGSHVALNFAGPAVVGAPLVEEGEQAAQNGSLPVVVATTTDGRAAVLTERGFEPTTPSRLARHIQLTLAREAARGLPSRFVTIVPEETSGEPRQAGYEDRLSRFLREVHFQLQLVPPEVGTELVRETPPYAGPGNVLRLGSAGHGRVVPVPSAVPNDEEGLLTALLQSAASQQPGSELADLYTLLRSAPGPVARTVRAELAGVVPAALAAGGGGFGAGPATNTVVDLLSDDEMELLVDVLEGDGRELRDIVGEALATGPDHPMWDRVAGLSSGSPRGRRRAEVAAAVRDMARGLGRVPSAGEMLATALRGIGPYEGGLLAVFGRDAVSELLGVTVQWVSAGPTGSGSSAAGDGPADAVRVYEHPDWDTALNRYHAVESLGQDSTLPPLGDTNPPASEAAVQDAVDGARRILRERLTRLWTPPPYPTPVDPPSTSTDPSDPARLPDGIRPADSAARPDPAAGRLDPSAGPVIGSVRVDGRDFQVLEVPGDGRCYFISVIVGARDQASDSPVAAMTVADLVSRVDAWFTGPAGQELRNALDRPELGGGPASMVRELSRGLGLDGLRFVVGESAPQWGRGEAGHLLRELERDVAADPTGAQWNRLLRISPALAGIGRRGQLAGSSVSDLVARSVRDPAWWHTPFFDRVPEIVAVATDLDVVTVRTGRAGQVETNHLHPSSAGTPRASVYVRYNGIDHHQAMVGAPVAAPAGSIRPAEAAADSDSDSDSDADADEVVTEIADLAVRFDPERGLVVAEGMEGLAEGLVGQPHVTSLFLRRTRLGELGVAPRAGGRLTPVTSEVLERMLTAAGWRGGPVQVWAPSESAPNADASDDALDESEETQALTSQLQRLARDLRTEIWLPRDGVPQRVVNGQLTASADHRPWIAVLPYVNPGNRRLTPPQWLESAPDGFLTPGDVRGPVILANGAASLTLPDYLDQLPFLRALDQWNTGIVELVLPALEGGIGVIGRYGEARIFWEDQEGRRDDDSDSEDAERSDYGDPRSWFFAFLRSAGWQRDYDQRAVRLWTAGGPGRSERILRRVIRTEVLVLDENSHGAFDAAGGGPRAIGADGEPTQWRISGPYVDLGVHRWESVDGRAVPRSGAVMFPGAETLDGTGEPFDVTRDVDPLAEPEADGGPAGEGRGTGEVLQAPTDGTVPVVTDALGHVSPPQAPVWLRMVAGGLASPDEQMVRSNIERYTAASLGYSSGAFPLDLPLLPDGRLGVTFGNGDVRSVEEIGMQAVVDAARAAGGGPIGTVVLWTVPPVEESAYRVFQSEIGRLAEAFGRPVAHVPRGTDPFAPHEVPGGPPLRRRNRAARPPGNGPERPGLTIVMPPAPDVSEELPGFLRVAADGQLVEDSSDRGVVWYEAGALIFGTNARGEYAWTLAEWHESLEAMPVSAGALPLLVVHTVPSGEVSWRMDDLVPLQADEVVAFLRASFKEPGQDFRPDSPVRLVATRMDQNEAPLRLLGEQISAALGGQPVYIGHDATYRPDRRDLVAPRWERVGGSGPGSSSPNPPPSRYVRDSATGVLVPLDHTFELAEYDASEWYLAGASIADLLVVPLIDDQGVYGVDLTGRPTDDQPPRIPGGFLVLAEGRAEAVLGHHASVGPLRVPPEQLAAVVLAHAPRGFAGQVYLGAGGLSEPPGARSPRPRSTGYAALLRAELGLPVNSTHWDHPDLSGRSGWQRAARLRWVPLVSGSVAGGMNLWSTQVNSATSVVARDLRRQIDEARARGEFPVLVGSMEDGRLALRGSSDGFEPVTPRALARLLRAEMERIGFDFQETISIIAVPPGDSRTEDYEARVDRFIGEVTHHLLDLPIERPGELAREAPPYQGPGTILRLGPAGHGRVVPVSNGIPHDEEGLIAAVLHGAATQHPQSDLAELHRLLVAAPGPVADAISTELGIFLLGSPVAGSGGPQGRTGADVVADLLDDDEVGLLVPGQDRDTAAPRDVVRRALAQAPDHPMWDQVAALPSVSPRGRRRLAAVAAVRSQAPSLGRVPSAAETLALALQQGRPYDGGLVALFDPEAVPRLLGVRVNRVSDAGAEQDAAAGTVWVYEHPDPDTTLNLYHAVEPLGRDSTVEPVRYPMPREPAPETVRQSVERARRIVRDRLARVWAPPSYTPSPHTPSPHTPSAESTGPVPTSQAARPPAPAVASAAAAGRPGPVTGSPAPSSPAAGPVVAGPVVGGVRAEGRDFQVLQVPRNGLCYFASVIVGAQDQAPGSPIAGMTLDQLRDHAAAWFTGPAGSQMRDSLDLPERGGGPGLMVRELARNLGLNGLRAVLTRSAPNLGRGEPAHLLAELETAVNQNPTGVEWNNLLRRSPLLRRLGRPSEFVGMRVSDLVARAIRDPAWWHTPFFDAVPQIVAQATDLDVVVVTTGAGRLARSNHLHPSLPDGQPRASVRVQYNGIDHYQALANGPATGTGPAEVRGGDPSSPGTTAPIADFAVRVDRDRGLVVAEGMEALAAGLVGQPHVTSVFLPRTQDGVLAVVARTGGEPVPLTSDVLRGMLAAAGWRGGPVQVWASDGAPMGSPHWWADLAEATPRTEALRRQAQDLVLELRTELWLPTVGAEQGVDGGRLFSRAGLGPGWQSVRPSRSAGRGAVTPPLWLAATPSGHLEPGAVSEPVVWATGMASATLPSYLDALPALQQVARRRDGLFEMILPREGDGIAVVSGGQVTRFQDEGMAGFSNRYPSPTFADYLALGGWSRDSRRYVDLRVWSPGGPGRSDQMLRRFAAEAEVEVLVSGEASRTRLGPSGPRAVDIQDRPTWWEVLGPLAERGMSRWVSEDGVARLRPDDSVVRTSTGLTGADAAAYPSAVLRSEQLAARPEVYEVRGFTVRRGDTGAPEFVIERLDGTSHALTPTQLPAYLAGHGWRPGQPLAVAENRPDDESHDLLTWQAWQQVGAAAEVFVFVPPAGVAVERVGDYLAVEYVNQPWEMAYAPAGRPVPLVTDPVGRLWPANAPTWLRMTDNGLAAPTTDMAEFRSQYGYGIGEQMYPSEAFLLDLPLLPDGRLGVGFGDGSARGIDEVGVDAVVTAAQAARHRPFEVVVLRTEPPTDEDQYRVFVRDAERLAAAFGLRFVLIRPNARFDILSLSQSVNMMLQNAVPEHGRYATGNLELIVPPRPQDGPADQR
ncbi:hypothetical protein ND748_15650 [Frankia sp. AiPs1]|uniref:hypothetical protein n=1 Tax=Frankia sp. AiPs1 TaxID=573493 RepID=UPI00204431DA|nr:hypothetical protein [Frankia sp. AiPs1]MCM3923092.1 hypothetical protein [Frankia sp. AiPs1]